MDLIERFRYLMKLEQLTASAFADEIGVQRSSVSHILSGRNKPSLEFIQKVLKKYPKVDANWLINGLTKSPDQLIKEDEIEKEEPNVALAEDKIEDLKDAKLNLETVSTAQGTNKKIQRILVFYDDQTFEEYKHAQL